jgi:hypothetical protein
MHKLCPSAFEPDEETAHELQLQLQESLALVAQKLLEPTSRDLPRIKQDEHVRPPHGQSAEDFVVEQLQAHPYSRYGGPVRRKYVHK